MSFVAIIMMIVKYGPAIFTLVNEIIDLIQKLREQGDPVQASDAKAELESAVKDYRMNKDRRKLRALRDRLNKRCFGDCE